MDWAHAWLMGIVATYQAYLELRAFFCDCLQGEDAWDAGPNRALLLVGSGKNGKSTIKTG